MQPTLTVSQCIQVISETLDATLGAIKVVGEVSQYNEWNERLGFFDIKDEHGVLSCMVPLSKLEQPLAVGMQVEVVATPKLTKKGRFNLNVQRVLLRGEGALQQAFELLQQRLQTEGLFDQERKRALPLLPEHIAVVTSLQSAAYQDMLVTLQKRCPGVAVTAVHTQVQGEAAPQQLVQALQYCNQLTPPPEVVVIARGGGSLEDLAAFNSESVVRAVSTSRIPTVVGTGHERDSTLAELAADRRAATPTDAIYQALPDQRQLARNVQTLSRNLEQAAQSHLTAVQQRLREVQADVRAAGAQLPQRQRLQELTGQLRQVSVAVVTSQRQRVDALSQTVAALDPQQALRRGYALLRSRNGDLIRSIAAVAVDDKVRGVLRDGEFTATVETTSELSDDWDA